MDAPPPDRGSQFTAFIEAELKREVDRRDSMTARSITAVTGATGLATLVTGLFAVAIGRDATIGGAAKLSMVLAVLVLLGAAFFALLAAWPRKYGVSDTADLNLFVSKDYWGYYEPHARWVTCKCMIKQIEELRPLTKARGEKLAKSVALQVIAVALLGLATVLAVYTSSSSNADDAKSNSGRSDPPPTSSSDPTTTCRPPLDLLLIC